MGREIAHVMGYQGAEWLERPERIEEERPDQVVEQMKLKPAEPSPISERAPDIFRSASAAS